MSQNSNLKTCTRCKIAKEYIEFGRSKSGRDGYTPHCKKCDNLRNQKFKRSQKGLINGIYQKQKKEKPNYSEKEFLNWSLSQDIFIELYKIWQDSDYSKDITPSCYKIDSDTPYTLNNIGFATYKEVLKKINDDIKSGVNYNANKKLSKPVIQYTKDGKFLKEFHSMQEAERQTGIPNGAICNVCQGKRKTAHGYKWAYSTNTFIKTKFGEKIEIKHLDNFLFEDIEEILGNEISIDTEKEEMVKCRIGQGKFRDQLIEYWKGCSVTNFQKVELLVASHIKPWRGSSNKERLDKFNGLLLVPNLDKLFDKGYISFDNGGKIIISKDLIDYEILGINPNMTIHIEEEHKKYLEFHRSDVFEAYNKTLERNS